MRLRNSASFASARTIKEVDQPMSVVRIGCQNKRGNRPAHLLGLPSLPRCGCTSTERVQCTKVRTKEACAVHDAYSGARAVQEGHQAPHDSARRRAWEQRFHCASYSRYSLPLSPAMLDGRTLVANSARAARPLSSAYFRRSGGTCKLIFRWSIRLSLGNTPRSK